MVDLTAKPRTALVASRFNLKVDMDRPGGGLYNTLNDTFVELADAEGALLQAGAIGDISSETRSKLISQGFLIEETLDELQIFDLRRRMVQCSGEKCHVFMTVTYACNCACAYCFQRKGEHKGALSSTMAHHIRSLVRSMVDAHRSRELQIDFFGGEPLLCLKMIEEECAHYTVFAAERGIDCRFRFYTNGTLLSDAVVAWLTTQPIKDLQITLDGPEAVHNRARPLHRCGGNSFRQTVDGLLRLQRAGIPSILRINFDRDSSSHVGELLDTLIAEGLKGQRLVFYPVQQMTQASCGYHAACSREEVRAILPELWRLAAERGFHFSARPGPGYLYCSASCTSSMVVDFKGRVFKCALLQEDENYQVGQITPDGQFDGPWPEYYRWMGRDALKNAECRACVLLPLCGGGCGGAAVGNGRSYDRPNCIFLDEDLLRQALKLELYG